MMIVCAGRVKACAEMPTVGPSDLTYLVTASSDGLIRVWGFLVSRRTELCIFNHLWHVYSPLIFTFEASRLWQHSQSQRHYIAVRQGVVNINENQQKIPS